MKKIRLLCPVCNVWIYFEYDYLKDMLFEADMELIEEETEAAIEGGILDDFTGLPKDTDHE